MLKEKKKCQERIHQIRWQKSKPSASSFEREGIRGCQTWLIYGADIADMLVYDGSYQFGVIALEFNESVTKLCSDGHFIPSYPDKEHAARGNKIASSSDTRDWRYDPVALPK